MAILNEPEVNVRERVYDFRSPQALKSGYSGGGGGGITIDDLMEILRDYLKIATYENDRTALNQVIDDINQVISEIPIIKVDSELSDSSTNPVENQAVTNAINSIECKLDTIEISTNSSYYNSSKVGHILVVVNTNPSMHVSYSWGQNPSKNVVIPVGGSMAFYVKTSGYGELYPMMTAIQ